jgi:hypothetical protein
LHGAGQSVVRLVVSYVLYVSDSSFPKNPDGRLFGQAAHRIDRKLPSARRFNGTAQENRAAHGNIAPLWVRLQERKRRVLGHAPLGSAGGGGRSTR